MYELLIAEAREHTFLAFFLLRCSFRIWWWSSKNLISSSF